MSKNNSNSMLSLEFALSLTGTLILIAGFCAALYVGISLKSVSVSELTGYQFNDPHPMRWWYAIMIFVSSICSSVIVFSLAKILNHLEYLKNK